MSEPRTPAKSGTPRTLAQRYLARIQASKHGDWMLAALSFSETLVVPAPFELIMVPYMLLHRQRIWWIATIALVPCVLAAVLGYWAAAGLFGQLEPWIAEQVGAQQLDAVKRKFDSGGFGFLLLVSVTPLPFQLGYLGAGAAGYSFGLFLLAIVVGRGVRYFGLALFTALVGERAVEMLKQHQWIGWLAAGLFGCAWLVWVVSQV